MKTSAALLVLLVACGGDDGGGADAATAASTITVSGTAKAQSTSSMPLEGVTIAAYKRGNDTTPVATTTNDASGNYTPTDETGSVPVEGDVKATIASYLDTYLYPPAALSADFAGASIFLVTQGTVDLLSNLLCNSPQMTSNGVVATLVIDGSMNPVAGATVSSDPAPSKVCYNQGGTPNKMAMMTDTDGIAYLLNVTGDVTVSASKSGSTFASHDVDARAGAFTTTIIQ